MAKRSSNLNSSRGRRAAVGKSARSHRKSGPARVSKRGFGAMSLTKRRAIAAKGGRSRKSA